MAQIIALLPLSLARVGVPADEVPRWVGLVTPLIFLVGLPFVPLWGVWADKYSRKAVIVRSAAIEAAVLAGVAFSATPWQLAASLALMGISLGNTGVMLAVLRQTAPAARLGLSIAIVGGIGPVGFALGPAIAALLVDGLGRPLQEVFLLSSALMAAVTVMLLVGMREVRPAVVAVGSSLSLAYGAMRAVVVDRTTRAIFLLFGAALLAGQMSSAYAPLLVERAAAGSAVVTAIGVVVGGAALVGGLATPLAGALGDRVGFRPVLTGGLALAGVALLGMSVAGSVATLAAAATAFALASGAARSMLLALLAVEVPERHRGTTLNLVYLPLYLAGILGPALGALLAGAGLSRVYEGAALIAAGAAAASLRARRASAARAPARRSA